mmetsp:Transcript_16630/g.14498  ORF Transcript_16630/g.14498 Transcript_16630/m.14498 type:complete len:155 (+) Transcript_16630:1354-1818(+)
MTVDQFGPIIQSVKSNNASVIEALKSLDIPYLFTMFDFNHDGKVDFKEFLSCAALLMNGPLSERIQYAFNMQDVSARGSLNEDEYLKFLDSIVNAAFVSNKGDTSAYFSEEAENFVETLKSAPKKIDKVKYNEIQSKILDHRFINYCNDTDEKR